ncbi:uncharacterized protein LOC124910110 [Impatiens glandulifera]|uniref:uncharacterized protein LOC124910110 n=1 Tax=Impatiens glandulifera TaxID=253017 RepID=UPI001FB0A6E7|nr:uncharacterized protein LOC124910110 [Impatiens glandulifera]
MAVGRRLAAVGILVMVLMLILVEGQGPTPIQCSQEQQQGMSLCKRVIFGLSPSPNCCGIIRAGHFECACPVIDAKLAALLNVDNASKLLRQCGRAVPNNFKCGSLYFP